MDSAGSAFGVAVPVDILTVGAHMGDEIAWAMALAAHRRQGRTVGMLHMTPGEKGHPSMLPEDFARQQREESRACAEVLDASWWALIYREGEIPVNDEIKFEIADIIRAAQPKVVISHWRGSQQKDNVAVVDNLLDALFYAAMPALPRVHSPHRVDHVYFGENLQDREGYWPEVFMEVKKEDLKLWEKAMACYSAYRGEVGTFPYVDYYRSLARTRGCEAGFDHAVTFALPPDARKRCVSSLIAA